MAFEYTPLTAENRQRQIDQYRPFQVRRQQPNAGGTAYNPNAAQSAEINQATKTLRGLGDIYKGTNAANAASASTNTAGTGYGVGGTLVAGDVGNASYAGAESGAGSAGGSTLGQAAGYAGMAKDAYGISQGVQMEQGVNGRDQGTLGGSLLSAGSGAAQGFSAGGPVGAIVGAALGNESYQWQHGNREMMTSPKGIIKSELTGGLAARDIGRWTGLWD